MTNNSLAVRGIGKLRRLYKKVVWGTLYGNTVHQLWQRRQRVPDRAFQEALENTTPAEMVPHLQTLRRDGIVFLPNFARGERLQKLVDSWNETNEILRTAPPAPEIPFVPRFYGTYKEYVYRDPATHITQTNNPFHHSLPTLELAVDEFLLGLIGRYFGKPFMLSEGTISRQYPMEPRDFSSWMWHHDCLGRRINVMVLLTDVTEQDQYMTYLKGSQNLYYPWWHEGGVNSRMTEDDLKKYPAFERVKCIGSAGTAIIFDSNGIHRGRRCLGAIRDAILLNYCFGAAIARFTVPRPYFAALTVNQQQFLLNNPRVETVSAAETLRVPAAAVAAL